MKKYSFILFLGACGLLISCNKPFDGVYAILSNDYIDYRVSLQVIDANPKATNYYPTNATITLSGDAVSQGLIYTAEGIKATEEPGNIKLVKNAVTLAVKPYFKISKTSPLKFTITANAPNYVSNSQDVVITNIDSLQYVDVKLLNLLALPTGVTAKQVTVGSIINGESTTDVIIDVTTGGGGASTQTEASVSIPAKTVFKDANNNPITGGGSFTLNLTTFNNSTPESSSAISGGLDNVVTSAGNVTFILGAAINITAFIGNSSVKFFTNPIAVDINLPTNTFNPITNSPIKSGDIMEVWSKNEGGAPWVKESTAVVRVDPITGKFKTTMLVTHLATWMVAFSQAQCASPLQITYVSTDNLITPIYVEAYAKGGNGQLITQKTVTAKNGDVITLDLPQGIEVNVVFTITNSSGTVIRSIPVGACATSATLNNNQVNTNPTMFFDLQTSCQNGIFRYSGPIEYKISGTSRWATFTPSVNGTLITNLLEWNKTYDFRIIYKGTEFARTKQVLQAEFRVNGSAWDYFGKSTTKQTFFNAPTNCN
jgi:hypothetical protein